MTSDDLRERIEIAKAATKGPWDRREASGDIVGDEDTLVARGSWPHDGSHIAANSPEAVIELCEELLKNREWMTAAILKIEEQAEELLAARAVIERLRRCIVHDNFHDEDNCDCED